MLNLFQSYHNFPKTAGIYKITTLHNNNFYIGSSVCLKLRMRGHRYDLKHKRHYVSHMQNIYNQYGESDFKVEFLKVYNTVLRINTKEYKELLQDEENFINLLNPKYNTIRTPTSQKNNPRTSKKIYQYTLNGYFIKEWNSQKEVIRELGIQVGHGLRGIAKIRSTGGYQWSFIKKDKIDSYISNSGCKIKRKVSIYDLFGKKLITFNSIQECVNFLNNKSGLKCDYQEIRNYVDNTKAWLNRYRFSYGDLLQLDNSINRKHKRGYIILQYDLNNNFIKIWGNTELAHKELKLSAIYDNICGKTKQCGKFIWKKL